MAPQSSLSESIYDYSATSWYKQYQKNNPQQTEEFDAMILEINNLKSSWELLLVRYDEYTNKFEPATRDDAVRSPKSVYFKLDRDSPFGYQTTFELNEEKQPVLGITKFNLERNRTKVSATSMKIQFDHDIETFKRETIANFTKYRSFISQEVSYSQSRNKMRDDGYQGYKGPTGLEAAALTSVIGFIVMVGIGELMHLLKGTKAEKYLMFSGFVVLVGMLYFFFRSVHKINEYNSKKNLPDDMARFLRAQHEASTPN